MSERVCAGILTMNRKAMLRQGLTSLLKQTRPLDAIVVVDNASSDGTPEMLAAEFPQVAAQRMPENMGGSVGFGRCVQWAMENGYDWVWLMDDDAFPEPDALERLLASPRVQACGVGAPRVLDPDGTDSKRVIMCVRHTDAQVREVSHPENLSPTVQSYPLLGLLVHRRKVEEVGNIREDFFIYSDDLEWTLRLSRAQGIAYEPQAVVVHHDAVKLTPRRFMGITVNVMDRKSLWKQYYGVRNNILLLKTNRAPYLKVALVGLLKNVLTAPFFGNPGLTCKVYTRAVWDGVRGVTGKRIPPGWQG